ncbi:hypothetical protein H632_c1715p0 [Helicosporidium sp. ATCC 50920]|nr:hypothetical protein H632_c1715p0 [Helicosporidium sp. ATCC 50920]|eukprot:KDD73936.1 hypothetical protein H632_c1715p0 [Helicosporidium sp. ATCC 50920]
MMADHMPEYLLAALNRLAGARARQARQAEVQDDAGQGVRPVLDGEERAEPGREAEMRCFNAPNHARYSAHAGTVSDEEHHDVHFENADAGASKTYPQQAGTIRKNGYIVIRGRPCKVADVSTSKTGKHGHAKCVFVGIDIFTGKKMEDLTPSSHNCDVPHVTRKDYTLVDIDDNFVSLMEESGDMKDDLTLPKGTDEADKLAQQIKADFEAGKELIISVLAVRVVLKEGLWEAMGEESICASKVSNAGN